MTRSRILLLLLLFLFLHSVSGRGSFQIDTLAFNKYITQLEKKYRIPDAEVIVTNDSAVIFRHYVNHSNAGKNYLIGSCSKSFTALTMLLLAEENKINIDLPVIAYLPWFMLSDSEASSKVTVKQLLNHTSGIPSKFGFFDYKTNDRSLFREKLSEYLKRIDLQSEPGTNFTYCNLNYLLLAMIAESATGIEFQSLLEQKVFRRIGMQHIRATYNSNSKEQDIQPFQYSFFATPVKSGFFSHSDLSSSYGNISASSPDLARWLQLMLAKGISSPGDTIISRAGFEKLTQPVKGRYSMGWITADYDSVRMIVHPGLNENFSSLIAFYPEKNIGIAIVTNINSIEFCSKVNNAFTDMVAGKPITATTSTELKMRWGFYIFAIITVVLLCVNLLRWKRYNFRTGIILKAIPLARFVAGLAISTIPVIAIGIVFNIPVRSALDFQPDIIWSAIIILVSGIISSLARYFGTFARKAMLISGKERQLII